jgi:transposase
MTLRIRTNTEIPEDTATLGQKLLKENNRYRVIGDHLPDIVGDEDFTDIYAPTGRDAVSPALLSMVTIFQFLEDVPDREAAEMVVMRVDWKYALHLPLDYAGFHHTDLCYFRRRLVENEKEALVFDTVLKKVKALGFLKKKSKQRTDSTHVLAVVQKLSRLELVTETMRVTLRAIQQADESWYQQAIPAAFAEVYVETRRDYRLSDAERQAALRQTGADGFWLLDLIARDGPPGIQTLTEVETLRTVWEQQYERMERQVTERKTMIVDCKELIVSPHETEARSAKKRDKSWIGSKVHVTETISDDPEQEPNFITDVTTDLAPAGDTEALGTIREHLRERDLLADQQIVDEGYISGQAIAESRAEGVELIGPARPDPSPVGFQLADFQADPEQRRATCPAGHQPERWSEHTTSDGQCTIKAHFGSQCTGCQFFGEGKCTTSAKGRTLSFSAYYPQLAARRLEEKSEAFWETMKLRPPIEGTLSEMVRQHGLRRSRYRGLVKTHLQNLFKAAALNLKRLIDALLKRQRRARQAATA